MDKQAAVSRENLKVMWKAIENVSLAPLESYQIPPIKGNLGLKCIFHCVDLNKCLDESFLEEQGLELPSALIGKINEQLDHIIKKASDIGQRLGRCKCPIKRSIQKSGSNEDKPKALDKQLEDLNYKISRCTASHSKR